MNLISCDNCAIVLDKDKLEFPTELVADDGSVNEAAAEWNNRTREFNPYICCPVCNTHIYDEKVSA